MKYYKNFDLLRCFLSFVVLFYHLPPITSNVLGIEIFDNSPIFHKGAEAVFCFFTLSGFLITMLLIEEKNKSNSINLKDFYLRRVFRIWPVYFLVLLFGFSYYHIFLDFFDIKFDFKYNIIDGILLCIFFLPNVFQTLYQPGSILAILWSIGVEEQFYLFWPILIDKIKTRLIIGVLLIIYFMISLVNIIDENSLFLRFRFYFDFMIIGGLSIYIVSRFSESSSKIISRRFFKILSWVLFIMYFFTNIFKPLADINQQLYHFVSSIIFISFLIALSKSKPLPIPNLFFHLGKISYGIYMYHLIIINFILFLLMKTNILAHINTYLYSPILYILSSLLTIFAAHVSYTYFEQHFLKLKNKFTIIKYGK